MTKKYIKSIYINNIITIVFWIISMLVISITLLYGLVHIFVPSPSFTIALLLGSSLFYIIFFFLNTRTYIMTGNIRLKYSGFEISTLIYLLSCILPLFTIIFFWLVFSRLSTLKKLIAKQDKGNDKIIKPLVEKKIQPNLTIDTKK